VVEAGEIQDSQTAKKAFRSGAVANGVGDAYATHTAGKTVVKAPRSLKQIFSLGQNFAAIEQSGQDQSRVHLLLDFF
jgi:hypothetical protein